jgi:hypothetical protein
LDPEILKTGALKRLQAPALKSAPKIAQRKTVKLSSPKMPKRWEKELEQREIHLDWHQLRQKSLNIRSYPQQLERFRIFAIKIKHLCHKKLSA